MGYIIDVIGLITFYGDTADEKLLLLPNNPDPPDPTIPTHFANIFVNTRQVERDKDWKPTPDPITDPLNVSRYAITTPSTIEISGQEQRKGSLVLAPENGLLQPLRGMIDIDPGSANTIAQIPINNGHLGIYILGGEAVCAQLYVKHDDLVTIKATPKDGSDAKTLILRKGVEFIVSNTSELEAPKPPNERTHFFLYAQLDKKRDQSRLKEAPTNRGFDELASAHPYIARVRDNPAHVPLPGCSITQCCLCCIE
jgi:hypothetical protein